MHSNQQHKRRPNSLPSPKELGPLDDWLRRERPDEFLRTHLESFLTEWLKKQPETLSTIEHIQPLLRSVLDPLRRYSPEEFAAALRQHVPLALGLKIRGWVNKGSVAKTDIQQNWSPLLDFMTKFLRHYRDTQCPAVEAPEGDSSHAALIGKLPSLLEIEGASRLDDLQPWIQDRLVREGIEAPLAALAAGKLVHHLRRQILIVDQSAPDAAYLPGFLDAWSRLQEFAERFQVSADQLLRLGCSRHTAASLMPVYRRFLSQLKENEAHDAGDSDARRLHPPENLAGVEPSEDSLKQHVAHYRAGLPSLKVHCDQVRSSGIENAPGTLLAQLFDLFLLGTTHTLEVLSELKGLMVEENRSYKDLLHARGRTQSPHSEHVLERVRSAGRMNMADYIRLCLYDSEHGYYVRPRKEVIPRDEFITLPEEFDDFGRGVALDLFKRWKNMGQPAQYEIIEMGAGSGKLAKDILDEVDRRQSEPEWRALREAIRYRIVEISQPSPNPEEPTLRDRQTETLAHHGSRVSWIETTADELDKALAPESVTGAFLSNELPDAFPVHMVRMVNGDLREVYVREDDGYLVEELGVPSTSELARFLSENGMTLAEGETRSVNLQAQAWVQSMARILKQGDILTFDYGQKFGLQTAIQNLHPATRTYGRQRTQAEHRFHGVEGQGGSLEEYVTAMTVLERNLGREEALAVFADSLKEGGSSEADRKIRAVRAHEKDKLRYFMEELSSSPLHRPAEIDITTDADFLAMQLAARRAGLEPAAMETQEDYFRHLHFEAADEKLYERAARFKVQVLHKDAAPRAEKAPALKPEEAALLEQNVLYRESDLVTLLHLIKRLDIGGLGACAGEWLKAGTAENLSSAGINPGSPLNAVLSVLIIRASPDSLPREVREYRRSIPELRAEMPFKDIAAAALTANVRWHALTNHLESAFCRDMHRMGYSLSAGNTPLSRLEQMLASTLQEKEKLALEGEPFCSYYKIAALHSAARIKAPSSGWASLKLRDLYTLKDGQFVFNVRRAIQLLLDAAGGLDFDDLFSAAKGLLRDPSLLTAGLAWARNPSAANFLRIREPLLDLVTQRLAQQFDLPSAPREEQTALGKRTLGGPVGQPARIESEPENTRNLTRVFGRFAAYVEHGLQHGGDQFGRSDLFTYIRLLDPSRDSEKLLPVLEKYMNARWASERCNPALLRLLYEKGLDEAAHQYVSSWELRDAYFTPEVIDLLREHGHHDLVQKYLEFQRAELVPGKESDFGEDVPFLFDHLEDSMLASEQFELEWAYVKTLLRALAAGKEGRHYSREIAGLCNRGDLKINPQDDSWDLFRPGRQPREMYLRDSSGPGPDGKYLLRLTGFIHAGLRDTRFRERAIGCIREMGASPMKLALLEEASRSLPEAWGDAEREEFLAEWLGTADACARQVAAQGYVEPEKEFPLLRSCQAGKPEEVQKYAHLLPTHHTESRYFREHLATALEWSAAEIHAGRLAHDSRGAQKALGLLTPLDNRLRFCMRSQYSAEAYRWVTDTYFYGGNHYAQSVARVHLAGDPIDQKSLNRLIACLTEPSEKSYTWDTPVWHEDYWSSYYHDATDYLNALSAIRELASRDGHLKEAKEVHELGRALLTKLVARVERDYKTDKDKNSVREWDSRWQLQAMRESVRFANNAEARATEHETLLARLRDDGRGFFSEKVIAEAAQWLSLDEDCGPIAVELFRLTVDKLAPNAGKDDWLPPEIGESLKTANLSDEQRDEVNHYALQRMWPQQEHQLRQWLYIRETITPGQRMVLDIIDHPERYPRSYHFTVGKLADAIDRLDPARHGGSFNETIIDLPLTPKLKDFVAKHEAHYRYDKGTKKLIRKGRIGREEHEALLSFLKDKEERAHVEEAYMQLSLNFSAFHAEYKMLDHICRRFVSRCDIWDPANFERLVAAFDDPLEAAGALRGILPSQAQSLEQRLRGSSLPSPKQIAAGRFEPSALRDALSGALTDPQGPEWMNAALALNAWFNREAVQRYTQLVKANEARRFEDRKTVFVSTSDYEDLPSYQLLSTHLEGWLSQAERDPRALQAVQDLLTADSAQESHAKACLAFALLGRANIALDVQETAFRLAAKGYLPNYVTVVHEQRYKTAGREARLEFYGTIALWDHTTPGERRPTTLWAHLFEAAPEDRRRLLGKVRDYLAAPDKWRADLADPDDWMILHHHMNCREYRRTYFDHYAAGFTYLYGLENHSVGKRIVPLLAHDFMDSFILERLLPHWKNPGQLKREDCLREYRMEPKKDRGHRLSEEDERQIFNNVFARWEAYLNEMRRSTESGKELKPVHEYRVDWDDHAARELFKIYSPEHDPPQTLESILALRFPTLKAEARSALADLARDPFVTVDSGRKEDGWWSGFGYSYRGEKVFHAEVSKLAGADLNAEELKALVLLMYPYSKTSCLTRERSLIREFPHELPEACARASYDTGARGDISHEVLQMMGRARSPLSESAAAQLERAARIDAARNYALKSGPVMAIAEELPRAACRDRARDHDIQVTPITLPESFRDYHPFARFLIRTYLNIMNAGTVETIGRELKSLTPDEALRQFFFITEQNKMGQLLRARPEVPRRYQDALRDVEDKVKPSDPAEVCIAVERARGWSSSSYELIQCVSAGSMGEVWAARHRDYPVALALKVLTPTKLERINLALKELKKIREILGWYRDLSREAVIAGEVAGKLIGLIEHEIDFRRDKENWQHWMGGKKPDQKRLKTDGIVPLPGGRFWSPHYYEADEYVLTMSLVNGVGLNDVLGQISGKNAGKELAQDLWELFRGALFGSSDGIFPMDLHPGNILLLKRELGDLTAPGFKPTRVLVDTGQMGRLRLPGQREDIIEFLKSATSDDPVERVLERLEKLGTDNRGRKGSGLVFDRAGLGRSLCELRESPDLLESLGRLSVEAPMHGLYLTEFLDPLKAFVTLKGGIQKLDPGFVFN